MKLWFLVGGITLVLLGLYLAVQLAGPEPGGVLNPVLRY
jgi:hypothetical protein